MTTNTSSPDADAGHRRTLRNLFRATIGTPPFLLQHGWRQRYLDRSDSHELALTEPMPPLHPETTGSTTQTRDEGYGPVVMRTFEVWIDQPALSAAELMTAFRERSNDFVPRHIAGFRSGDAEVESMQPGEEFVVELPGPWNGPVRVDAVDDVSVLLVTLRGHMEAGHIRFAVIDVADDGYRFQIRSWARAGDELFKQLHLVVGVAHEAQTAMWVHTCDRAVAVSGGKRRGAITAQTEQLIGSCQDG